MIYLKKPLIFLVILILAISLAGTAMASDEIKVFVNESEMSFPDQKPVINSDNRTLVPVRFVSQALGAAVGWTEASKKVTVELGDKVLTLAIGKREATVGAYTITLDTAAALMNDRTMVPLRFISEGLGANVQWDDSTRTIYITTGAEEEPAALFVGTPTTENTFKYNKPADKTPAGSQYMYVTADQLPIKLGDTTIYSVTPGVDTISVKQSTRTRNAVQVLIIQDGIVTGGRTGYDYQSANPFTAQYDTRNRADEALGAPRVDINKVNAFVLVGYNGPTDLYLIVDNPINAGDWQP
jgi:hypothetical protein